MEEAAKVLLRLPRDSEHAAFAKGISGRLDKEVPLEPRRNTLASFPLSDRFYCGDLSEGA